MRHALPLQIVNNGHQLFAKALQQIQAQPSFLAQTLPQCFFTGQGEEQGG